MEAFSLASPDARSPFAISIFRALYFRGAAFIGKAMIGMIRAPPRFGVILYHVLVIYTSDSAMGSLKYLPPEDKKMYTVVTLGVSATLFGVLADAVPALGTLLFPLAALCAVAFVAAFVGPAERLFPLRTLPRRISPALSGWAAYILKVLLFFGVTSAVLYLIARGLRRLQL